MLINTLKTIDTFLSHPRFWMKGEKKGSKL